MPSSEQIHRIAGLVVPDELLKVGRYPFSGHVYNLETETGFYVADSILTHNCRCNVIYRQASAAVASIRNPNGNQFQNGHESKLALPSGTVPTVNCPRCGRRQPMNNVRGTVDVYCRHCDLEFPVSSEGAPQMKRIIKRVTERDDDGHVKAVEVQEIG